MTDDLTAALEEIQKRASAAANFVLTDDIEYEEYRRISASTQDVPRLLAALRAVLELHSAWEIREGDDGEGELERVVCRECCAMGGAGQAEDCAVTHMPGECWPCDTHRAISSSLSGKEKNDG